jgi:predicted DNA-binding protein YlxM (UPF0122 family)
MANLRIDDVMTKSSSAYALETESLFNDFSTGNRSIWGQQASEDREFRLGKQWSDEDRKILEERSQAALVINRVHPAVELAKSILTANKPTFRVTAAEDSDSKTASAINGFIQYIWNISSGDRQLSRAIDDFYVTGLGALLVYIDPFADGGRGEVMFRSIDPMHIYIDPNSQDEFCSDASDIIISRTYTKGQLKRIYPAYQSAIDTSSGNPFSSQLSSNNSGDNLIVFAGSEVSATHDGDYVRGYERYTKVWIEMIRVYEQWSKAEYTLTIDKFEEYLQRPVWIINQSISTEEVLARQAVERLTKEYEALLQQYEQALSMAEQNPEYAQAMQENQMQPPQPPQIQQLTMGDLLEMQQIKVVKVPMQRIYMGVVVGDKKLYGRLLNCSEYPIITMMNMHTGSPYPLSDVRMIKDMQRYINKIRSLIVAHASTSTNVKIMVPRGTDVEALKKQWSEPGAIIELDFTEGTPIPVAPLPMPNELYQNEITAKSDIDHQLGLFDSMMGNSAAAPDTYRGIMMLDEFGQRRIKVKQAVIEQGVQALGKVIIDFIQEFYIAEKQIRILQPNNSLSEYAVNKRLYDDYGQTVGTLNDVSVGKYDVLVISGSTLPSNRFAQLEFYREMYKDQIIDRVEVLKKSDVFDIEGVLQRIDTITQLQQELESANKKIQELQGDMQTRDRELFHAKLGAAVNQEQMKVRESALEERKASELYTARLGDTLKNAGSQAAMEIQKIGMEERDRIRRSTKDKR